jgi:hypothetical protein
VLSYNAATLQQERAYTAEPGETLASIWQKGAGLSADSSGNIYAESAEGFYDIERMQAMHDFQVLIGLCQPGKGYW